LNTEIDDYIVGVWTLQKFIFGVSDISKMLAYVIEVPRQ